MKEINKHKILITLILIILIAALLRILKFNAVVSFDSDQEFFAWEAKKILIDHKLTLIGIPTQIGGVLIGPLFTYLSTLVFFILKGNPISTNVLTVAMNLLAIPVSYFVANKLIGKNAGLISAALIAFSKSSVIDGLAGWPVTPILGTTFIFIYFLVKFLEGNQKYLPLIFITMAIGLNWHVMSGFYLFVFLISLLVFKIRPNIKYLFLGLFAFGLILSPLLAFDLRHDFINTKNILSLFQNKTQIDVIKNFFKVISIALGNASSFFTTINSTLSKLGIASVFLIFIKLSIKDKTSILNKVLLIFLGTVIFFASIYKGELSEYYLATLTAVFVLIVTIILSNLSTKHLKYVLIIFCLINLYSFSTSFSSLSLKYKMQAVSFIVGDSQDKNFVLHIDSGHGQGSGFKYLFYYLKKEPTEKGDHLYLLSIPWSQKAKSTTNLLINNYKAGYAKHYYFGDIAVMKIF